MSRIDPRKPTDVCLPVFKHDPPGERPTFRYRRTNAEEWERICAAYDSCRRKPDDDQAALKQKHDLLFEALTIGLLGWERQVDLTTGDAVPFDADQARQLLPKLMNGRDAFDLLVERLIANTASAEDKKKSESSPSCAQDSSASAAVPASVTQGSSQPN